MRVAKNCWFSPAFIPAMDRRPLMYGPPMPPPFLHPDRPLPPHFIEHRNTPPLPMFDNRRLPDRRSPYPDEWHRDRSPPHDDQHSRNRSPSPPRRPISPASSRGGGGRRTPPARRPISPASSRGGRHSPPQFIDRPQFVPGYRGPPPPMARPRPSLGNPPPPVTGMCFYLGTIGMP